MSKKGGGVEVKHPQNSINIVYGCPLNYFKTLGVDYKKYIYVVQNFYTLIKILNAGISVTPFPANAVPAVPGQPVTPFPTFEEPASSPLTQPQQSLPSPPISTLAEEVISKTNEIVAGRTDNDSTGNG